MSTLERLRARIDTIIEEDGEHFKHAVISVPAVNVYKILAFVDAFDSYAFDLKDKNFKDLADARRALDEEPK